MSDFLGSLVIALAVMVMAHECGSSYPAALARSSGELAGQVAVGFRGARP